jgi:hypothetical protein
MVATVEWNAVGESLPAASQEDAELSVLTEIVVVKGFVTQTRDLGQFHFPSGLWQGRHMVYGRSEWFWVSHWRNLGALPPLPTKEAILKQVQTLEPDFVASQTVMRALFGGVAEDDEDLKEQLFKAVCRAGTQGVPVATRGFVKGQYYIDFSTREALELREVKQNLDAAGVAYTIRPRESKRPKI